MTDRVPVEDRAVRLRRSRGRSDARGALSRVSCARGGARDRRATGAQSLGGRGGCSSCASQPSTPADAPLGLRGGALEGSPGTATRGPRRSLPRRRLPQPRLRRYLRSPGPCSWSPRRRRALRPRLHRPPRPDHHQALEPRPPRSGPPGYAPGPESTARRTRRVTAYLLVGSPGIQVAIPGLRRFNPSEVPSDRTPAHSLREHWASRGPQRPGEVHIPRNGLSPFHRSVEDTSRSSEADGSTNSPSALALLRNEPR